MAVTGLDGHAGTSFVEFTRGETVPFTFQFMESDEVTPIDVTGYTIYIAYALSVDCDDLVLPELEVTILPTDALAGIMSGEMTDTESFGLASGNIYVSARYVKADGRTYVIDKAMHQIYNCINPRRV